MEWVTKQLRGALRSGVRKTTLRLPTVGIDEKGEDVVNVEMRWNFDGKQDRFTGPSRPSA
jgi:hypothetical protein